MLKIWGRLSSINVRKVVWCAQELGLAYERTEAGGRFGVVQTPDYLPLNPAGRDAFMQWVRTPVEQQDAAAAARSVQATERLLGLLDAHLSSRTLMTGARFTMADIPVGCELHRWFGLPAASYTRPAWPHLERYFDALRARPAAQGVLDQPLA